MGTGAFDRPQAMNVSSWSLGNDVERPWSGLRGDDALVAQLPIAALQGSSRELAHGEHIECAVCLDHLPQWDRQELEPEIQCAGTLLSKPAWEANTAWHCRELGDWSAAFQVETPDAALNRYLNEWVPLQLRWVGLLDRGWPTSMRGTRDASQDYSGITSIDPDAGLQMLRELFACQRRDGSFPRQVSTAGPDGAHDLRDYVDSGCWVLELLYDALRFSGNLAFLDERLRWLDATDTHTVAEHATRLLEYYMAPDNRGPHGLIRIRGGDWNDSLNRAGRAKAGRRFCRERSARCSGLSTKACSASVPRWTA